MTVDLNKIMAENKILKHDPAGRVFNIAGKGGRKYGIAFDSDATGQEYAEGVSDAQLEALLEVRKGMRVVDGTKEVPVETPVVSEKATEAPAPAPKFVKTPSKQV